MRARIRSAVMAGVAVAGISALAISPVAPPAEGHSPPTVVRDVQLTAAPSGLGAIPWAFLRNQGQYCNIICPDVVQGAITVPLGAVQSPAAFLGTLQTTGSLLQAIGAAAGSVTAPARAAAEPIITNDLSLVLPKAQNALQVAVVGLIRIGSAVLQPGQLVQTINDARTNTLAALNQPIGAPVGPTGARTIFEVAAVEAINVASAVLFQAGEMLLLGVVQTADAAAQTLAQTGDIGAALSAGGAQAGQVVSASVGVVTQAVDTAVTNIHNAINDPFPTSTTTATTTTKAPSTASPSRVEKVSTSDDSAEQDAASGADVRADTDGSDAKGTDADSQSDTEASAREAAHADRTDTKRGDDGTDKHDKADKADKAGAGADRHHGDHGESKK
jgi:hypothetical protein